MSETAIKERANPQAEAYSLARAMVRARNMMITFYDKHELHNKDLALTKVLGHEQDEGFAEMLSHADPEQLSWFGINHLSACGREEDAARLWNSCKSEALDDFDSGHHAASVVDRDSTPAQRARFVVLRDAFRQDWQPRGATELALVDQLTQMHYMYEKWLTTHVMRIDMESYRDYNAQERAKEEHKWISPRQNEVEATREAADIAERFQKGFLRTLRALRDLRRYVPQVVIQNAGQVNVANQQVNLA